MNKQISQIVADLIMNSATLYALNETGVNDIVRDTLKNNYLNDKVMSAVSGSAMIQTNQILGNVLKSAGLTVIEPKPLGSVSEQVEKVILDSIVLYGIDYFNIDTLIFNLTGANESISQALIIEVADMTQMVLKKYGLVPDFQEIELTGFNSLKKFL